MVACIAIDWGTTNLRAFALGSDGQTLDMVAEPRGILAMQAAQYPEVLKTIRIRLGDANESVPVLIAGMAGSNRGWIEAPYVECPADAGEIAGQVRAVPGVPSTWIVPGLRTAKSTRADVMRGEEVQILGSGLRDGILCLPGTHTKWAQVESGRISGFATVMAGELFDLLRKHGILSATLAASGAPDPQGFAAGLKVSRENRVLAGLFSLRAVCILDGRSAEWASGYLSGLLIGEDVREGLAAAGPETVHVIGAADLSARYAQALESYGASAVILDGGEAFTRGIMVVARSLQEQGHVSWTI
ncbi:MAG TPA: 2-oxo-3-deoxygalactonate kinase [Alphaproteobacteria bacterium]|nr:2-oxo-3-deoxygalactonate kinase [Alphaproteobacteria bacterium]HAJ45035.1 2-oxo-3-deoxygalactonate kinase [Alphaproteobacteria bacterium]